MKKKLFRDYCERVFTTETRSAEFGVFFNRYGLIPRSLLRRDSGVGWVER